MDSSWFDHVARSFATAAGGRALLGLALGGVVGATARRDAAGKQRKKKKVKFNEFGCVSVNKSCKNASQCCSGICKGKKGKKRCKAHDTGGCQPGTIPFACDGTEVSCTTSAGQPGSCGTTTGNAGYCFSNLLDTSCTTDRECQAQNGPRAACVTCPTMAEGTLCAVDAPLGF